MRDISMDPEMLVAAFRYLRKPIEALLEDEKDVNDWLENKASLTSEDMEFLDHFLNVMEDHPAPVGIKRAAFFCIQAKYVQGAANEITGINRIGSK
jgi:hypothetical protein